MSPYFCPKNLMRKVTRNPGFKHQKWKAKAVPTPCDTFSEHVHHKCMPYQFMWTCPPSKKAAPHCLMNCFMLGNCFWESPHGDRSCACSEKQPPHHTKRMAPSIEMAVLLIERGGLVHILHKESVHVKNFPAQICTTACFSQAVVCSGRTGKTWCPQSWAVF